LRKYLQKYNISFKWLSDRFICSAEKAGKWGYLCSDIND
jgi:hypothetical protein